MRKSSSFAAKDLLAKALKTWGFEPDLYAVFEIWDNLAGHLKGIEAVALKGRRIVVRVASSVHAQELKFLKSGIISQINGYFGRTVLTDVAIELPGQRPRPTKAEILARSLARV